MALMPPDGYPIVSSYADLRRAMERAQYDPQAAVAVRNFLMEAAYYRSLVASGQMNQSQYFIALENLRQLQKDAAANGYQFTFETSDGTGRKVVHNPPAIEASKAVEKAVEKKPFEPEGVHFTSHQRVGDEIRDTYIEHIHEMFAGGFIDADEHDARLAAMMLAHTKEEMEFLIQDLPSVSPPSPPAPVVSGEVATAKRALPVPAFIYLALSATAGLGAGSIVSTPGGGVLSVVLCMILVAIAGCCISVYAGSLRKK